MSSEISILEKRQSSSLGAADRIRLNFCRLLLNFFLRDAWLELRCPAFSFTAGKKGAKAFTMEIDSPETLWDIMKAPDPRLGETYMNRQWELVQGDLGEFLTALARNAQRLLAGPAGQFFSRLLQGHVPDKNHDPAHSRRHVAHHYDLGNDLYRLFLDEGMNYSCAFFDQDMTSLRQAQLNKIGAVIRRLGIGPGMNVLDIGCGWGEAAAIVAHETGAEVTGITLAEEQLAVARTRTASNPGQVHFHLEDYRNHAASHQGHYDRIYSIGMFEHVGADSYPAYFGAIRDQLKPDGKALIHAIVTGNGATRNGKLSCLWLERYIFPGGEICGVDTMLKAASAAGLIPAVPPYMEPSFSYAETLRCWRTSFTRNMGRLDPKYDERFRRMWLYYLAMCESMFDGCGFQVTQIVFQRGPGVGSLGKPGNRGFSLSSLTP